MSAGPVYFVAYIYYLSKYVELLDTCILALKGKTMSFLHVFHHAVMPIMCWLWLQQRQSLHEIALLTNTSIHVIMYYYYFLSSIGKPPKWKKLVTQSQILQFVFRYCILFFLFSRFFLSGTPCSAPPANRLLFTLSINPKFCDGMRLSGCKSEQGLSLLGGIFLAHECGHQCSFPHALLRLSSQILQEKDEEEDLKFHL